MLPGYIENILYVGLGGFIGANLRYGFGVLLPEVRAVPGTLFVNVSGSVLLGVFLAWAGSRMMLPPQVHLLVATGFFGSFTTFSTFANESVALAREGTMASSIAYIAATNMLCILGAALGYWFGNRL